MLYFSSQPFKPDRYLYFVRLSWQKPKMGDEERIEIHSLLGQACVAMGNIFVDRKNTEFDLKALEKRRII